MLLKVDECRANCGNFTEGGDAVVNRMIFELQQIRQLIVVKFADTGLDILRQNEIKKFPLFAI